MSVFVKINLTVQYIAKYISTEMFLIYPFVKHIHSASFDVEEKAVLIHSSILDQQAVRV